MPQFQDVFIAAGDADTQAIAAKLGDGLKAAGLTVDGIWGQPGPQERAIRADACLWADTVIWVLSTDPDRQTQRLDAIEQAWEYHKQLVLLWYGAAAAPISMGAEIALHQLTLHPNLAEFASVQRRLLDLIDQHRDYVHRHTQLLARAMEWDSHLRQPQYLLAGEECQQAEAWLATRFVDDSHPCIPHELHYEFITESVKRANGGMTQAFLVYADGEPEVDQIRHSLIRAGIPVWSRQDDVQVAVDMARARQRGLEQADNVVVLVSPSAIADASCRQALEYAHSLHKRIIPILAEPTPQADSLPPLRGLRYIDLTDNLIATDYRRDESELLKTLRTDATYYEWHKRILVKALTWEEEQRSRAHLLLGGEFAIAKQWLHLADQLNHDHPPTDLHRAYIAASEEMNQFYDLFISYGRIDSKAFATELHRRLTEEGYRVWFDQNDIPLAVDFQEQINDGIAKAHNFLFVISPHAVNSPYCAKELSLAQHFGKRIIPVMHVESISYEIWQTRHPSGTLEDWQTYQTEGRHTSYTHLDAVVRKLNWIFFRDHQDDPEAAYAGLIQTMSRHQDYVQQHTYLLIRALSWQQHQHQSSYLLTGPNRIEAEAWLKRHFDEEQAPCEPIPLQTNFVCASLKYADNWMTQVFLAHSETDHAMEERVRLSLMREGITVWSSKVDIQSGQDFQAEIDRGIENTDNLMILLSTAAINSPYCLHELAYALKLKKRIIPLLVQPLNTLLLDPSVRVSEDLSQRAIYEQLKKLQFIDLTTIETAADYHRCLDKALHLVHQDANYYRDHKLLLTRSLTWQRQQRNPSILLRGATLSYYETWLQFARQRSLHGPTDLQQEFVAESQHQPPNQTLDVYLSCAPSDLEFGRRLSSVLQVQGKTTWLGSENSSIAAAVEPWQQSLERCQTLVVILSPKWVKTNLCQQELAYAQSLSKRVVVAVYQSLLTTAPPAALATAQQVDFQDGRVDFLTHFGQLYRLIERDPQHVQRHTRLVIKAMEWEQSGRDDSFLLRGQDLVASQAWLQQADTADPLPSALQRTYIQASHQLTSRRVRPRTVALVGIAVTAVVITARGLGLLQSLELRTYDRLLALRPSEKQDSHMLLIKVDEESGRWLREQMKAGVYQPGIGTVPDAALDQTLQILEASQPALIGLDFYRDFDASPTLGERLQQSETIISLCKASTAEQPGVPPPSEVPPERIGFNDFVWEGERFVRRHYLKQEADPDYCNTSDAFSLILARDYLAQQGVAYVDPWKGQGVQDMVVGQVRVPQLWVGSPLGQHPAAYAPLHPATFNGYQTMLNFRTYKGSARDFAPSVSLADLLQGKVSPDVIRDRIVLIGYSDRTDRNSDFYTSPYGELPGVVLQGQMASQLVNAALEGRSLIWWWSTGGESLWILAWSVGGGWLVWWLVRPKFWAIGGSILLLSLGGICYGVMVLNGGWLPLLPTALGMVGTGTTVGYLSYRIRHP